MASKGNDAGQGDIGTFAPVHERGNAMLIINIKAKNNTGNFEFKTRDGANADSANLQMVFINRLGFKWMNSDCHEDLTTEQWDHRKGVNITDLSEKNCTCMRCRIRNTDHSKSECFVLAISSHGREITETEIIFSDGNSILLTEIFAALSDENCPTLKGKPRIIILQACRANFKKEEKVLMMQDKGVPISVMVETNSEFQSNSASGQPNTTEAENNPEKKKGRFRVEPVEDHTLQQIALPVSKMPQHYLLVYPVVSGQKARRHEIDGSWLVDGLKKIVQEKYSSSDQTVKPVNFLHLLTEVSGFIARERESITYRERNENQSDEKPGNQPQQNDKNRPMDKTEEIKQNQSQNEQKTKRKSKKGWVRDEEKSGFKNAVCFHHRLVQPIIFYPEKRAPELPPFKL